MKEAFASLAKVGTTPWYTLKIPIFAPLFEGLIEKSATEGQSEIQQHSSY
jgi:hypothetical protein